MTTSLKISQLEYQARTEKLLAYMEKEKLSGIILFDNFYILYYTGFAFIPTERPIAYVINSKGNKGLFVPCLELEHARSNAFIDQVENYLEYPYRPHPMNLFKEMLFDMEITANYGADHNGYPWLFGYRGPSLSELLGKPPLHIAGFIEDQMAIKSPGEVVLIRESVKWGHLAHVLLQRYTEVGRTETEVSLQASGEATLSMHDTIGPIYQSLSPFSSGAEAGYRGQIGRNAAIPHALAGNIIFQEGDVLVTGANAPVWGYNSELERTMIIGPATDAQKRMFDHMVVLQDIALSAIKPGIPCSAVDRAVRAYYEKHDLMPFWKHHVGHTIGLRYHEGPYLDLGDETIIQPGMVFTVEPGLYSPDLGGFRHSDTAVVTENGLEILTYYPRDLQSLTIPA